MATFTNAEAMIAAIGARLDLARASIPAALEAAGKAIVEDARDRIGTYQSAENGFPAWAPLTEGTQEQRAREGYTANDPLLRSGELRDAIQSRVEALRLTVGVPDTPSRLGGASIGQIASWMEWGTLSIPRRPFILPAFFSKRYYAVELVWTAVKEALR